MLCLFVFHMDYTIYENHVLIKFKKKSNKRFEYLTVFSLRTFSREVKVVQSWFNRE